MKNFLHIYHDGRSRVFSEDEENVEGKDAWVKFVKNCAMGDIYQFQSSPGAEFIPEGPTDGGWTGIMITNSIIALGKLWTPNKKPGSW